MHQRAVSLPFVVWMSKQSAPAPPASYSCQNGCCVEPGVTKLKDLCTTCVVETYVKPLTAPSKMAYIELMRRVASSGIQVCMVGLFTLPP